MATRSAYADAPCQMRFEHGAHKLTFLAQMSKSNGLLTQCNSHLNIRLEAWIDLEKLDTIVTMTSLGPTQSEYIVARARAPITAHRIRHWSSPAASSSESNG